MVISLKIRSPQPDDVEILYQQQADPAAHQMARFEPRDVIAFYQHWHDITHNPEVTVLIIEHDGMVIGDLVCWQQEGQRLVGYWLGQEYWGQGFASQALSLFTKQLQHPLHAYVHQDNLPSQRVLEKSGFIPCGQFSVDDGIELLFRLD